MNKHFVLFIATALSIGSISAQEPSPSPTPTLVPSPTPVPTPTPTPSVSPTPTPSPTQSASSEPPVARAELVQEREIVTRLQIFLDQQNFGTGKIDGRWGEFTGKAVSKYAQCHGLQIGADIYQQLPLDSVYPVYTTYQFTADDLKWVGATAHKPSEQAKLKALLYSDLLEFVSERYHCDPEFLQKINKGVALDKLKAGDTIRVPNVAPFKIEEVKALGHLADIPEFQTRSILVNRKDHMATLYDGQGDDKKVLAAFPITPGSDKTPSPPGKWSIIGISSLPTFRWDEGVLNHGKRTNEFFMLPSGPRNPVGVVWIGLSKPGIGMHGTNNPNTIGRAASHGCMRLANWDAVRLAHLVTQKIPVTIQ